MRSTTIDNEAHVLHDSIMQAIARIKERKCIKKNEEYAIQLIKGLEYMHEPEPKPKLSFWKRLKFFK